METRDVSIVAEFIQTRLPSTSIKLNPAEELRFLIIYEL